MISDIKLPKSCYKYQTGKEQIQSEISRSEIATKIETENEILLYLENYKFPWRGNTTNEDMFAMNQVKAILIENLKLLTRKQFILGTLYTFLNTKELQLFIDSLNRQMIKVASPYILKEKHLDSFTKELISCVDIFLRELGIDPKEIPEIFGHMIYYDNAYKMRLIDILSETTKDKLSKSKEISRLARIIKIRDTEVVSRKFNTTALLIRYVLYIPKIKRAFRKMIDNMNLKNLQYDENYSYWSLTESNYNYKGKDFIERRVIHETLWK